MTAPGSGSRAAILAGDLCLQWSDELYATSGLPSDELDRGRRTFDTMRTQLMGGQYLDLLESARGWDRLDTSARIDSARNVIRYKSAKYTVEHPILIGAAVGGVAASDLAHLSEYGLALGEAFQLRDDVLGVFGDPSTTGKPAGDDLREGKRTVLVALALDQADTDQAALFEKLFGQPDLDADGVAQLRGVIADTGAVDGGRGDDLRAGRSVAGRAGEGTGAGRPGGGGPRLARGRDDLPLRLTGRLPPPPRARSPTVTPRREVNFCSHLSRLTTEVGLSAAGVAAGSGGAAHRRIREQHDALADGADRHPAQRCGLSASPNSRSPAPSTYG